MRFIGAGPLTAARQAAVLFALAGALAVVGIAATPGHTGRLIVIAGLDLLTAAVAWRLPWTRWHPYAAVFLIGPALTIIGVSTWAFGGFAAGTGPFFVLAFAWLGLHFPPWVCLAVSPAGVIAYVLPLLATGQSPDVIGSAAVLVPTAVGVGMVIARQVEHQRRDRERIAHAERWRAALTATLAHDLRSPLTTVQLVLEELRDEDPRTPAARREALVGTALRQLGRVSRLTAGLLDVERVDSRGDLRLDLADVPVRRAVREAIEQINGREVLVDVDPGLTVRADPERLEQMLINLTTNALRHGRPPVVVGAGTVEGRVFIEVRDHGPGVRPEARDRLFTPFAGRSDVAGSTGLGLWIVDRLARAHGGEVRYETAEPGARLVLTLPAGAAAGSTEPPEPPEPPEPARPEAAPPDTARPGGDRRWAVDAKSAEAKSAEASPADGHRRRSGTAAP
ncbi:MAG TPA: HAMP domain-containing sensor histidine kinase [Micromonosporaceae bacterium]|nr:HAMP domain-containing sensor histidine kinase [Micromonosporaceae bacterium]